MTKTFSLQPLLHLARQRNDAAIRRLGMLNQNHQAAQGKLDMLQQYRRDYQQKLQHAEKNGLELQDLRNFQDFIYRLDDAIAQQNTAVMQAQLALQQGRSELTETQRRMKSYDTLAQRHNDAEKKLSAKIEQQIQDEHSGRRIAIRNMALNDEN
jgi:flagellar protein FliJ